MNGNFQKPSFNYHAYLILLNIFLYVIVVNSLNLGINPRADAYLSIVQVQ